MSAVEQAMRATNRRFESDVIKGGRFDLLDQVYAEDATVLPPDGPIIEGIDAIRQFWKGAVPAMGIKEAALKTVDIVAASGYAHEIGLASLTVAGEGDATSVVVAKYVVVWKLMPGGQWRWYVDIWNGYKQ